MIKINILDGENFSQMIISGANNLYNNRHTVDDLNVFPVPDGDTGTNMSLTITALSRELSQKKASSLTKAADIMAFAALRGARGNSGVILSQFFRGISKSLKGMNECGTAEFASALNDGSAAAYKAVMRPTEGTILTVAREAAAGAQIAASGGGDITAVLEAAVKRGNDALKKTPEQLPALKQAGVVDAGGQGWMFVLEGALEFLHSGKSVIKNDDTPHEEKPQPKHRAQESISTEDIKFSYCTEFIIEKKEKGASADKFRETISPKGDCMLVIDDEDIVKVHIHTNHPGFVLEEAIKLGEMINLKIDNMKHQHNSLISEAAAPETKAKPTAVKNETKKAEKPKKKPAPKKQPELKDYGFAAIAAGKDFAKLLRDLGIDKVIEGGQTMNPSTEDILKAVNRVKAKTVYVFPNNKNIILAAKQAAELAADKKVIVIPTRNIPQCISAVMSFNPKRGAEDNENAMNKAAERVRAGQVTYAVRDTEVDGTKISKGDILGIDGSSISVVGNDRSEVLEALTERLIDEDTEYITVYYGKDIKKAEAVETAKRIEERYSADEIEVSVKRGGQPVYYYIIGIE